MRQMTIFMALGCLLMSLGFSQRENKIIKVGCIDMQKIIDKVASDRALKGILKNKQGEFLKEAEKISREIKKLKEILDKEESILEASRVEQIKEEIILKEEQLKEYLDQKSAVLKQREQVLNQEILINVYKIIKEVSIKEGYSMVVEKNTAVVYSEESIDITKDVIKALDEEKKKLLGH